MRISERTYLPDQVAGFQKTREKFGGLSNMASGYPMVVNGIEFDSSEALYQACRFPFEPDLQRSISAIASPMAAKMEAHRHVALTREDWKAINVEAMRWCLKVKLSQNLAVFGAALEETGDLPIVEISRKDSFWGTIRQADGSLRGCNVLGRLEMELRQAWKEGRSDFCDLITPPPIPDFLFAGNPVDPIKAPAAIIGRQHQLDMGF